MKSLRDQLARLQPGAVASPTPSGGADAGGFTLREPGDGDAVNNSAAAGGETASADAAQGDGLAIVSEDDPFADARAQATQRLGSITAPPEAADPQFEQERAGPVALQPAPAPADETELAALPNPDEAFRSGRNALYDGDFGGAQERFLDFVAEFPDDPRIGEAQYWLGETYFVQGDYADSADAYVASLRADPRGDKAGDSFVRLAASLAELGETEQACDTLDQFSREFPNANTEARRKARREALRIGCG